MSAPADPKPASPVVPVSLGLDDKFQFRCRKGIACFNRCCENADILLTPYDVLRLARHFGLRTRAFIDRYTYDAELDPHGTPGLKLARKEGSTACVNLAPEGCGVYADRPLACRYYALGHMAMRRKDSPEVEDRFFVVKEAHCLGHQEPVVQTIREYRRSQGIEPYDDLNREWREIVLKKRSTGPTVGRPLQRSFELFFLASYDLDRFRDFVTGPGFTEVFDLDLAEHAAVVADDERLLRFGFRLLRQVLFGERTIPLKTAAVERRRARLEARLAAEKDTRAERWVKEQDGFYASLGEGDCPPD